MEVERNRASGSPLRQLNEDPGVTAKRRAAFAAMFLSLRRHDPDQVRRVSAPRSAVGFRIGPAASQPLAGAPLGRSDYLQSARQPSRLRFDDAKPSWPDLIRPFTCPTLLPLLPEKLDHRVKPGVDD